MTTIHRLPDSGAVAERLGAFILDRAARAAADDRMFSLALAGGSTPELLYRRLSKDLPQSDVKPGLLLIFWGDERCVPLDDRRSNYRMAHQAWLSASGIPQANVHPILCQDGADSAAARYETEIRSAFASEDPPRLDLILLGLGADGHTASLFPGGEWVDDDQRLVLGVPGGPDGLARVSITPRLINAARAVVFLVTGADKAAIVQRVIEGPHEPASLPAQAVEPDPGELHWFLDAAAAQEL